MDLLYTDSFWSWIFLILGCLCLLLEIFIPSGGVLGILSVLSAGFAVFGFFQQGNHVLAVGAMIGYVAYAIIVLLLVLRRVSFKGSLPPDTSNSVDERIEHLVGKEGRTLTPLRPAGMASINGQKIDVVSFGDFIDKDTPVRVVDISGNRVVVRAL